MGTTTKTLYETDFAEWAARTADLLRQGRLTAADVENVAEEIEDLGRSERTAVRLQLLRLLTHLVKQRIQPERDGSSWRGSIVGARQEILLRLEDSPSLRRHLLDTLQATWQMAIKDALAETGLEARAFEFELPKTCPCSLDQLMEGDLEGLWPGHQG
jgi:hypothetical protein